MLTLGASAGASPFVTHVPVARRWPPVRVAAATIRDAVDVAAFLRSLPRADLQLRFGGSPEWLIERLFGEAERGATIARIAGRPIGLIDFVRAAEGVEIGAVVAPAHRRCGVASALLAATRQRLDASEPVIAYASLGNVPAVRWLHKHGFVAGGDFGDPLRFVSAGRRIES